MTVAGVDVDLFHNRPDFARSRIPLELSVGILSPL